MQLRMSHILFEKVKNQMLFGSYGSCWYASCQNEFYTRKNAFMNETKIN